MRVLFSLIFFNLLKIVFSQIHPYYSGIDFSLSPSQIKSQLSNLVSTTHHTQLVYTPDVWDALKLADLDPNDVSQQNVILIYGHDNNGPLSEHRTRNKNNTCNTSGSCIGLWQREHVFPRSLGTPNLGFENAGSDAHAIRPIDAQKNSSKSNRIYGYGSGTASYNIGTNRFYPGNEWIGDVARMIMYMNLRYGSQCQPNNVAEGPSSFHPDIPDVLLIWNASDPVSILEQNRNEVLYTIQGNRNPFIDNPYLATLIWGGPAAMNTWSELSTENLVLQIKLAKIYPNPACDVVYVNLGDEQVKDVQIFSIEGKKLKESNSIPVDIRELQKGIYFLKINGIYVVKLVKSD